MFCLKPYWPQFCIIAKKFRLELFGKSNGGCPTPAPIPNMNEPKARPVGRVRKAFFGVVPRTDLGIPTTVDFLEG